MALAITLWLLVLGVAVFIIYSYWVEPERLGLSRLRIAVPGLPEELEGLRLLHLSDLHVGDDERGFAGQMGRRAVELALAQEPELVCVTGDLGHASRTATLAARILQPLAAVGAFVVMGNHDHDKMLETEAAGPPATRLSAAEWRQIVEQAGLTVLQNEWITVEIRGKQVVLAGVGDPSCGWDDLPRALAGAPPRDLHLLLVHSPDLMDDPRTDWADLVLCGHTHGGQIKLPGLGTPWAPVWRDRRRSGGLLRFGRTLCHVTRGVAAGIRARFLCPPEVCVLTLTKGPGHQPRDLPRWGERNREQ